MGEASREVAAVTRGASPSHLMIRGVTKRFQATVANDDVSFDVALGSIHSVVGQNGAGKSTTINCLTGFYPPTSGEVLIEGFNVHQDPKKAKQHLGVCSQEDTLDTDFDVLDQMRLMVQSGEITEFVSASIDEDGICQIHVCAMDLPGSIGLFEIGKHLLISVDQGPVDYEDE